MDSEVSADVRDETGWRVSVDCSPALSRLSSSWPWGSARGGARARWVFVDWEGVLTCQAVDLWQLTGLWLCLS